MRTESAYKFLIGTEIFIISFICITLNSKNSFIYAMNDSVDIQQFVTVVRCIANGDVLYRDIYEIKGPVLFFLYYVGMKLSGDPFTGAYFLEVGLFFIYLLSVYKISSIYLDSKIFRLIPVAVTGIYSTTMLSMHGGGQCEELVLPALGVTLYMVLRYEHKEYPRKISAYLVITAGVLFALVFWTKYSCVGLFIGLVVYIAFMQIKDRTPMNILVYSAEFLIGAGAVTIVVFIYFLKNNALSSLFTVYFSDVLFLYGSDAAARYIADDFYKLLSVNMFCGMGIIYVLFAKSADMKRNERGAIVIMLAFQAALTICSHIWDYSSEIMQVFTVFGVIAVIKFMSESKNKLRKLFDVSMKLFDKILCADRTTITAAACIAGVAIVAATAVLSGSNEGVTEVILISTTELIIVLSIIRLFKTRYRNKKFEYIVKYSVIVFMVCVSLYFGAMFIYASLILLIMYLVKDIYDNRTFVIPYITRTVGSHRIDIYKGILSYTFLPVILVSAILCFSPVVSSSKFTLGDYPQYQMSTYINNSSVDNPVIVNMGTLETGVYYFTGTYPPTKYISDYNFLGDTYIKVVEDVNPDFIVSSGSLDLEGYICVYEGTFTYLYEENHRNSYYLYQKEF